MKSSRCFSRMVICRSSRVRRRQPKLLKLPLAKVKRKLPQRPPRLQSSGHPPYWMRRPSHLRGCWGPHAHCVFWLRTVRVSCHLLETPELMTCNISETLRDHTRDTMQYGSLKHLYLSGTLVDETDTSPWRVKTPNRGTLLLSLWERVAKTNLFQRT